MTADKWEKLGVPLPDQTAETLLMAEAALEWVWEHTTLSEGQQLPNGARLFLLKYIELLSPAAGVVSESLGGISQTMDGAGRDILLRTYAKALLGPWLKSENRVIPAKRRWDEWR